ncbi:MAG: hypothetical protein ACD_42C00175G0003 [uncultured bacterium]|nr:MAG: hypothetical protein ACD_42C00175G0003 [uncultured bacterium]OGT33338.1 MAG: hypothetical protein A3C44_03895 [Gammaproteobacteria bacterium RIFCSPHIGHO2_02_FULL_39_13]OGT50279.1 MAG: hypothetical protein A3E53_00820 [Gammaproteobacteria bacterium RIFCSPHIGHO2_12_FULL_39_24]
MKRFIVLTQFAAITAIYIFLNGCSNSTSVRRPPHFVAVNATHAHYIHSQSPRNIALLLPQSGSLAPYASAIRNGFFTAYYYEKNHSSIAPTIAVYNTAGKNIQDVVQTAIKQGADFVVGPLDKSDVMQLANTKASVVPILALNTTPSAQRIDNDLLFEFGLSPTDEAQQAAMRAQQDHHKNVVILAPNSVFGQRLVNAFTQEWTRLGGTVVATQYYGSVATLSKNVATVLQINNAYQNERELKNMFRENMRFIPQRRNDFDSIFLVASPGAAQQIQPLLQFYFAGNIPIYATSQIYPSISVGGNNDLNGIIFCDMPWVLAPNQMPAYQRNIQQRIQSLWPDNYNHFAKFYAMGVDAFYLTLQLKQMQSQMGVSGATGTLYLTPQHYVYRQLVWAQFQNGQPQLIR